MTPNIFHQTAATLVRGGFAVIPLKFGEKRPTYEGWTATVTTLDSVEKWPDRGNIGVLTETTPAVDLDILDPAVAGAMQEWIIKNCGEAPVRIGRAPKRLLVFRTNHPFRKITSRAFVDAAGERHRVEVLGQGQQFVAWGVHPDTKRPYTWPLDELTQLEADDLPLIDADAAQKIVAEFERRALEAGWTAEGAAANGHAVVDDDLWFLYPKPDMTLEQMREAIAFYANPGRDYDLWIKVGMALHHQFDGAQEGLDLWLDWSARSPLFDDAGTRRKWDSFGKYPGRVTTIGFILSATHEARRQAEAARAASERAGSRDAIRAAIDAAKSGGELMDKVLPMLTDESIDALNRDVLLRLLQRRYKTIEGVAPGLPTLRQGLISVIEKEKPTVPGTSVIRLEYDLAGAVLERHYGEGEHLMFFSNLWWMYRRGIWRRTEEASIRRAIQSTLLELESEDDERLRALAQNTIESRGDRLTALVSNVFQAIANRVARDGMTDPLCLTSDRKDIVINTQNCELWFDGDGEMRVVNHEPRHALTMQVGCLYDATATCPTWDAAIRRVFQECDDPENVVRHFEEVMGYILQPTRHQAIWVMVKGGGGNGKTFLTKVISEVMGDSVHHHRFSEMTRADTHFTDSLQGKLMLLDDDLASATLLADDWIKRLSEAKSLTANPKFGRPYNFVARSVPVILTNSWPATTDLTDGLRRRAMVFPSYHKLTEKEKDPRHLQTILEEEMPGVLNRLIAGLRRFLARGHKLEVPAECKAAMDDWVRSSNSSALFVSQVIERTGDRSDYISAARLYDIYRSWMGLWEHNAKNLTRTKFYEAMTKLGLVRTNHGGAWVFSSVKLRHVEGLEKLFLEIPPA